MSDRDEAVQCKCGAVITARTAKSLAHKRTDMHRIGAFAHDANKDGYKRVHELDQTMATGTLAGGDRWVRAAAKQPNSAFRVGLAHVRTGRHRKVRTYTVVASPWAYLVVRAATSRSLFSPRARMLWVCGVCRYLAQPGFAEVRDALCTMARNDATISMRDLHRFLDNALRGRPELVVHWGAGGARDDSK